MYLLLDRESLVAFELTDEVRFESSHNDLTCLVGNEVTEDDLWVDGCADVEVDTDDIGDSLDYRTFVTLHESRYLHTGISSLELMQPVRTFHLK